MGDFSINSNNYKTYFAWEKFKHLDKDKREPVIIPACEPRVLSAEEKEADMIARKDELDDKISIVSGWNN